MNKLLAFVLIITLSFSLFAQEIIFEKEYSQFPFDLRIENSGIYSIASFDVDNNLISFTSASVNNVRKRSTSFSVKWLICSNIYS